MARMTQVRQWVAEWWATSFPFQWNEFLDEVSSEPIPDHLKRWWFALAGTPLYLFVIQVVTGITLTFYYTPTPDTAFESVTHITNEVRYGWYIRSIHHWAANLMVFTVILHVLRVFFTRAYRHPRELNWVFGSCLLLTTFGFGFTGYSLVYEQLSYWAAVVGTNIAAATPVIGGLIARFMRGGDDIGPNTLTRFFVFHVGVLPTAMFMLLGLHILQIRLHGVSVPEGRPEDSGMSETFPFFPDHFFTELIIGLALTIILTVLALIVPAPLGERANPNVTPAHIKPEWYFFPMFRWLKLTTFEIGIVGAIVAVGLFMLWPFVDRLLERAFPKKQVSTWIGVVVVLTLIVFTIWEAMV